MLRTMLAYKLEERGKELVKVDRFFTSSKRSRSVKKWLADNGVIYSK